VAAVDTGIPPSETNSHGTHRQSGFPRCVFTTLFLAKIQCLKSIIFCAGFSFQFICPNQVSCIQLQITCQNRARNPALSRFKIIPQVIMPHEVPHLGHHRRLDFLNASLDKPLAHPNRPTSSTDLVSDVKKAMSHF
jgi:hypothetical protein